MSFHTGQTSIKSDSYSDQMKLAVPTQRNKALIHETLPFKNAQYQPQDELILLQNTAASQSRKESLHYMARQEIRNFIHLIKVIISSAKDADL